MLPKLISRADLFVIGVDQSSQSGQGWLDKIERRLRFASGIVICKVSVNQAEGTTHFHLQKLESVHVAFRSIEILVVFGSSCYGAEECSECGREVNEQIKYDLTQEWGQSIVAQDEITQPC